MSGPFKMKYAGKHNSSFPFKDSSPVEFSGAATGVVGANIASSIAQNMPNPSVDPNVAMQSAGVNPNVNPSEISAGTIRPGVRSKRRGGRGRSWWSRIFR